MSEKATITADSVVAIHYTLTDGEGEELDSSREGEPLTYLHGHGNLLPALESELENQTVGYTVSLDVAAKDGYGERDPERILQLPRENFDFEVEPGAIVRAVGPGGVGATLRVESVTEEVVTVDANHPLAGRDLHFEVEVMTIREATQEELDHGHVHHGHDHCHGQCDGHGN